MCVFLHAFMQNELAAQRVVRLLLADPWLLYKEHSTVMSVLMVVPQNCSGAAPTVGPNVGAACVEDSSSVISSCAHGGNTGGFDPATAAAATTPSGKGVPCSDRNYGDTSSSAETPGGLSPLPVRSLVPMRLCFDACSPVGTCRGKGATPSMQQQDRDVQLLIELSVEGSALDIRSFPQQIVQLISADDNDRDTGAAGAPYFPQEDFSPHDSIILNASSGDMP